MTAQPAAMPAKVKNIDKPSSSWPSSDSISAIFYFPSRVVNKDGLEPAGVPQNAGGQHCRTRQADADLGQDFFKSHRLGQSGSRL